MLADGHSSGDERVELWYAGDVGAGGRDRGVKLRLPVTNYGGFLEPRLVREAEAETSEVSAQILTTRVVTIANPHRGSK